jgi:hypothetical protein
MCSLDHSAAFRVFWTAWPRLAPVGLQLCNRKIHFRTAAVLRILFVVEMRIAAHPCHEHNWKQIGRKKSCYSASPGPFPVHLKRLCKLSPIPLRLLASALEVRLRYEKTFHFLNVMCVSERNAAGKGDTINLRVACSGIGWTRKLEPTCRTNRQLSANRFGRHSNVIVLHEQHGCASSTLCAMS